VTPIRSFGFRPLAMGLVLALGVSVTTCRLDKLINPATADRLVVNPDSVRLSADSGSLDPKDTTLHVASADGVALTWTASKTAAWVSLSPSPDSLVVTLHPATLSRSVHSDTIVFTSLQTRDTVRVPVVFDILPAAAHLVVSPTSRDTAASVGSAQPDTFSLRIKNTGALPLTWTAAPNVTWVTLSASGGSVPAQDTSSTTVLVTLRPDTLSTGPHSARVVFSATGANGSPDTVPITYRIDPCVETAIPTLDATRSGSIALSDCGAPQRAGRQAKLYRVQAAVGDTLTFRLTSAFNAYLILTDSAGTVVLDETDQCAAALTACLAPFNVATAGRYVIEVTSTNPAETGAFTLSAVKERAPSPPQSALQFRKDSTTAIGVGTITLQDTVVFKATVNDPNPGDSVRLEVEVIQTVSTFLGDATDSSAFVSVASGARQVAVRVPPAGSPGLQDNASYHWQARTCDKTARCSAWLGFGQNADTAVDFVVNALLQDPVLDSVSLNQYNGTSTTPLPVGQGTGGGLGSTQTVTFKGIVTDPDPGDDIVLEVEVKATGAAFNGSGLLRGAGVKSGSIAAASFSTTVDLLVTKSYHWRAHACDQTGRCSAWVSFGNNAESATDFQVP
jgi:BACON domain-containing protein